MPDNFKLIALNKNHIPVLYHWNTVEDSFERFTCRPVPPPVTLKEYTHSLSARITSPSCMNYVLVHKNNEEIPLARIQLFDCNPRNHSAEFGYYMPLQNRHIGYGSILLKKFIDSAFSRPDLALNKLYATTCSDNIPSVKLLEKFGFTLDGRLRQHYWIGKAKYDQCVYSLLKSEWV